MQENTPPFPLLRMISTHHILVPRNAGCQEGCAWQKRSAINYRNSSWGKHLLQMQKLKSDKVRDRKQINCRWVVAKIRWAWKPNKIQSANSYARFSQVPVIDNTESYALAVRLNAIQSRIVLAKIKDAEMSQFDIKGLYMNAKFKEEIFMRQPKGFNNVAVEPASWSRWFLRRGTHKQTPICVSSMNGRKEKPLSWRYWLIIPFSWETPRKRSRR